MAALVQVVVVVSRWWVWCPGGGCSVQVVGVVAVVAVMAVVVVVAVMAVVVVVAVLWLPLDLQVSTGKLVLLSRCKTPSLRAQVSLRPGDHGSRPQPKLNFEFYIFDPVNDGWGGSHWSEVELGLELGPEKGHLFALFIVCFAVYRLL